MCLLPTTVKTTWSTWRNWFGSAVATQVWYWCCKDNVQSLVFGVIDHGMFLTAAFHKADVLVLAVFARAFLLIEEPASVALDSIRRHFMTSFDETLQGGTRWVDAF